METAKKPEYVAVVGLDINNKRYEAGDKVPVSKKDVWLVEQNLVREVS